MDSNQIESFKQNAERMKGLLNEHNKLPLIKSIRKNDDG